MKKYYSVEKAYKLINKKIHIQPSFTTRKLKQLQQENEDLETICKHLDEVNCQLRKKVSELQQENKELKEDREFLFEENHNKEQVIIKYQDNWDKLKLWTKKAVDKYYDSDIRIEMVYENVLNKMQELEKGEKKNEFD